MPTHSKRYDHNENDTTKKEVVGIAARRPYSDLIYKVIDRSCGILIPGSPTLSMSVMANDFASDCPARVIRTSLPRKLPSPPVARPESKRGSRPLPKLPRALICKKCGTCISSQNVLFPESMVRFFAFLMPVLTFRR